MANIIDNLNTLETNIDNAKFKMAKNLKDKGVQALPSDKLDILVDKIVDIPSGSCNLQELNVTENGVYTPQAGDVKGYNKVTVNVPSSGGGGPFDFGAIGYTGNEEPIKSGLEYAKQIYDTWDPSLTSLTNKFKGDKNLMFMPLVDTSNVTRMEEIFNGCSSLLTLPKLNTSKVKSLLNAFSDCSSLKSIPLIDTSNVTDMRNCFRGCTNLITIPNLDTSKADDMGGLFTDCSSLTSIPIINVSNAISLGNMFSGCESLIEVPQLDLSKYTGSLESMFNNCKSLTTIPFLDTSKASSMTWMFYGCTSLKKIEGIDLTSCLYCDYMIGSAWDFSNTVRYVKLTNLGAQENVISFGVYSTVWGFDGDGITGCRKSLTDSLIVNSFDRAAAGFGPCTITLSAETKGLLTEDEISQITAKGFTLA